MQRFPNPMYSLRSIFWIMWSTPTPPVMSPNKTILHFPHKTALTHYANETILHLPSKTALTQSVKVRMKMITDALPNKATTFLTKYCPTSEATVATPTKQRAATPYLNFNIIISIKYHNLLLHYKLLLVHSNYLVLSTFSWK